ncbi:hypothetical protein EKG37_21085 [Robertmurraya yapensis]|uniref:Integrase n=1 Tax=Bacillus yapensis TaxID=2492960 RepID=A0A3S0L423_9BACI|nr:tyrosine-type recombinase/integrase [Bacillus yapensis]RTR26568.1 hypothetical protein EKG37_21085 [Bacillus yapensis]TKS93743.1 hypothetical protein FAR12_21090 [Bacillus yapensis]
MTEIGFRRNFELALSKGEYWKNKKLFHEIEKYGFSNINWTEIPDDVLLYIFIHDQPTIGEKRKNTTKKEYLRDLNQLLSYLYNPANNLPSLRELKPEDLLGYQRYLEGKYKKTTLLRKTSVVKHFFRYLASKEILNRDITLQLKRPKTKYEELVNRDLFNHEVSQLLEHFKMTDWFAYSMVFSLVTTGMRIMEFSTAKWRNLRYEERVGLHVLTVLGKGDKERDIIIFDDVLEVIKENRRRKNLNDTVGALDDTAFFPKSDGTHYNSTYLSNEFTRLVSNAPFDFIKDRFVKEELSAGEGKHIKYRITPHTCRHYTAAFFMDKGIDLKSIQDLLGHASMHTTDRYLRRKRSIEQHAAVKLGEKSFINSLTN